MSETSTTSEELSEQILEKIDALCRGFLMIVDKSIEKACSFCRGLLILFQQLFGIMPEPQRT